MREKSSSEHKYTSTGIKFWRHQQQMMAFKNDAASTIISTHISPESNCNLKCSYCSVTHRTVKNRIELPRIKQYVRDLSTRGLRAVILTGGGEPTLYPQFNELVQWIKNDMGLSVALITNGTTQHKILPETMKCFSWIRVSINTFNGWQDKISLNSIDDECTVGCSFVYNSSTMNDDMFSNVSKLATKLNAKYVRVLPNCLLEQNDLLQEHDLLDDKLNTLGDDRFFHQYKIHGTPKTNVCHQSYFRPYLSEETFVTSGIPGTVYPCDSVVLNDGAAKFVEKYQLCAPENILDFLDRKIEQKFKPCEDCKGCVFTDNVNMLDDWKNNTINRFNEFQNKLQHEDFV